LVTFGGSCLKWSNCGAIDWLKKNWKTAVVIVVVAAAAAATGTVSIAVAVVV